MDKKPDMTIGAPDLLRLLRERQALQTGKHFRLGFPRLEELIYPTPGLYVVLGGKPGTFKTSLAWTWALNLSLSGLSVLWVGLEMPPEEMALMTVARLSGVPRRSILSGNLDLEELAKVTKAWASFENEDGIVCPLVHHGGCGRDIVSVIASANRGDYDVVIVDYLQLIDSQDGGDYERVTRVSKELSRLSGKQGGLRPGYKPMVVALSHFSRGAMKEQEEQDRFPDARDYKGSSQVEQDADVALVLHQKKSEPEGVVYMKVVKNRYGPKGKILALHGNGPLGMVTEDVDEPSNEG